jgi:hypothetical protein
VVQHVEISSGKHQTFKYLVRKPFSLKLERALITAIIPPYHVAVEIAARHASKTAGTPACRCDVSLTRNPFIAVGRPVSVH